MRELYVVGVLCELSARSAVAGNRKKSNGDKNTQWLFAKSKIHLAIYSFGIIIMAMATQ